MHGLTKFIFSYTDKNHDFENYSYRSLFNRFTTKFWIRRSWLLRIYILSNKIEYEIRPWSYEFEKHIEIPMIPNSSLNWLSGAHLHLSSRYLPFKRNTLYLNKIYSLLKTIDITHFNAECRQIPAEILINILILLQSLTMIRLSDFPSYEDIYTFDGDINAFNEFLKNNQITNLIMGNISNFQQIDSIHHLFRHIKYLSLQYIPDPDIESIAREILLKIKKTIKYDLMTLSIHGFEPEYDKLRKLKQMIDLESLLNDYTLNCQFNTFYLQWK